MSNIADTDEDVEVSDDGLTVRKAFVADEFPVPAIRFEIDSERDVPVSFRLSEPIPESFPMDNVGFHPEYHSDDWTAFQDNHVEFTGTVDPDDSLVTVYGIRLGDEDDAGDFLTEPTIEDVHTDDEVSPDAASDAEEVDDTTIEDIISDDRNQVVKDMLSGESDSVPGLDVESTDESTADDTEDESFDDAEDLDLDLDGIDTDPVDIDEESDDEDDVPDIELGFGEDEIPDVDFEDEESDDESEEEEPEIDLDVDESEEEEPEIDLDVDKSEEKEPEIDLDVDESEEEEPEIDLGVDESEEEEPEIDLGVDESEEEEPEI
ncbi:AAA family ATPase, partial [Natribaculum luteum]